MTEPLAAGPAVLRTRFAVAGATLLCFLLPLVVYLPTPGDYWILYDNELLIRSEPIVQALARPGWSLRLAGLVEMFTTAHGDLYQPLLTLSLAIDYALFGWDRSGWHAHSLLLHLLVTAMSFLLAYRLVRVWWAALAATLFASLHPVAVEAVSSAVNRTALLTLFWVLLGSHAYLYYARDPRRWRWLALATLAFGASCMAHTIPSIVLLPFFFDLWLGRRGVLRLLWEKLPLIAVVAFFTLLSLVSSQDAGQAVLVSLLRKLWYGAGGLALSAANSLAPQDLALLYPASATWEILGFRVVLVLLGSVGVLLAGAALWRRGQRGLLLSAAAWLVLLVPSIAVAMLFRAAATTDRYLYISLFFAAPGIAQVLAWLPSVAPAMGRGVAVLFLAYVAVLSVQARGQARDWADEVTLWRAALAHAPHPVAYGSLGNALVQREDWRGAVDAYGSAVALIEGSYPGLRSPIYYEGAMQVALAAAKAASTTPSAGSREAHLAFALEKATRAAALWPEMGQFEIARGQALMGMGEPGRAIEVFERALELDPRSGPALVELGVAVYRETGDSVRAADLLDRALREQHADLRILQVLSLIYESRSQFALAAELTFTWAHASKGSPESRERFLRLARRGLASTERAAVRPWVERYLEEIPEPGAVRDLLATPRP